MIKKRAKQQRQQQQVNSDLERLAIAKLEYTLYRVYLHSLVYNLILW